MVGYFLSLWFLWLALFSPVCFSIIVIFTSRLLRHSNTFSKITALHSLQSIKADGNIQGNRRCFNNAFIVDYFNLVNVSLTLLSIDFCKSKRLLNKHWSTLVRGIVEDGAIDCVASPPLIFSLCFYNAVFLSICRIHVIWATFSCRIWSSGNERRQAIRRKRSLWNWIQCIIGMRMNSMRISLLLIFSNSGLMKRSFTWRPTTITLHRPWRIHSFSRWSHNWIFDRTSRRKPLYFHWFSNFSSNRLISWSIKSIACLGQHRRKLIPLFSACTFVSDKILPFRKTRNFISVIRWSQTWSSSSIGIWAVYIRGSLSRVILIEFNDKLDNTILQLVCWPCRVPSFTSIDWIRDPNRTRHSFEVSWKWSLISTFSVNVISYSNRAVVSVTGPIIDASMHTPISISTAEDFIEWLVRNGVDRTICVNCI